MTLCASLQRRQFARPRAHQHARRDTGCVASAGCLLACVQKHCVLCTALPGIGRLLVTHNKRLSTQTERLCVRTAWAPPPPTCSPNSGGRTLLARRHCLQSMLCAATTTYVHIRLVWKVRKGIVRGRDHGISPSACICALWQISALHADYSQALRLVPYGACVA
jgi:hypothetical protein